MTQQMHHGRGTTPCAAPHGHRGKGWCTVRVLRGAGGSGCLPGAAGKTGGAGTVCCTTTAFPAGSAGTGPEGVHLRHCSTAPPARPRGRRDPHARTGPRADPVEGHRRRGVPLGRVQHGPARGLLQLRAALGGPDPVANVPLTDADRVQELTGGHGAHAVFDLVGIQPLPGTGPGHGPCRRRPGARRGGLGHPAGGDARQAVGVLRPRPVLGIPLGAVRGARTGPDRAIHAETEIFLDAAPEAYEKLHAGQLRGRAVIVP